MFSFIKIPGSQPQKSAVQAKKTGLQAWHMMMPNVCAQIIFIISYDLGRL